MWAPLVPPPKVPERIPWRVQSYGIVTHALGKVKAGAEVVVLLRYADAILLSSHRSWPG